MSDSIPIRELFEQLRTEDVTVRYAMQLVDRGIMTVEEALTTLVVALSQSHWDKEPTGKDDGRFITEYTLRVDGSSYTYKFSRPVSHAELITFIKGDGLTEEPHHG